MAKPEPYYIDVDLKKESEYYIPKVTQRDTDVVFIVRVTDDGREDPTLLDDFTTITLTSERKDKKAYYVEGKKIPDTNEVKFELGTNELEIVERVTAAIQFYSADGRQTSAQFYYDVKRDMTGVYTPSENESSLIETVLVHGPIEIAKAVAAGEAALAARDSLIEDVTDSINTLETDKTAAITATTAATNKANTAATTADTARTNIVSAANAKITEVEALRVATVGVKDATQAVQNSTKTERDNTAAERLATAQVRADTLIVQNQTKTVKTDTEAVKNATESVRAATEAERLAIIDENDDLQTLKDQTTAVKNETKTVQTDTLKVKNDTLTVKGQAETVITQTNSVKDATDLVRTNSLTALEATKTATTNANAATVSANAVADNTAHLGAYNAATAYKKNNVVSYNGSSYMATQNTTGNLPTNATYWRLLAQKGVDGSGSVSKVNNMSPDGSGNVMVFHINATAPADTKSLWIDTSN